MEPSDQREPTAAGNRSAATVTQGGGGVGSHGVVPGPKPGGDGASRGGSARANRVWFEIQFADDPSGRSLSSFGYPSPRPVDGGRASRLQFHPTLEPV